ncbi:MAG: MFS transporter [Pseudomonadota bacterium]
MLKKYWVGRDVLLLWVGQVITQAGDSVYQIALIWLMLDMTGSSTMTGLAGMTAYLPSLVFGLFAGVMSDRFDRRRIMMLSDVVRAGLVLAIPLLFFIEKLSPLWLVVVTFMVASVGTLFNPARDSIIPDIAPKGKLELSNSLVQTSWQLAMFVGPAIAGLLIPLIGIIHLFEFDSATFILSMFCILAISRAAGRHALDGGKGKEEGFFSSATASVAEGLRYAWNDKRIKHLLIITAVYNIFLMGVPIVATPVFVKEILDGKPETYAWLQAVYAGGMVIGAPLAVFLSKRVSKGSLMLAGIIFDGLTFIPLCFAQTNGMALLLMFIHSIFVPLILVPRATMVQRIVERRMLGRVFSMM